MKKKLIVNTEALLDEAVQLIMQGHLVTIKVKGNSMLPFLYGDVDRVVLSKVELLEKYDIVLVKIDSQYILHRIVEIDKDRVVLMGDGNLIGREYCQINDILAKAITKIRNGKEYKFGKVAPQVWLFLRPIRRYLLYIIKKII